MPNVKELLASRGLTPNKALGQNFLIDEEAVSRIVEQIPEGASVLEIGPGAGAITLPLAKRASRVTAVEIDASMTDILRDICPDNVSIINADFLELSNEETVKLTGGAFHVAANLPYYVTTPICLRLTDGALPVQSLTLMLQSEASERLLCDPGDRVYGPLRVQTAVYFAAERLFSLSPHMYWPQPDVDSTVVRLVRNDTAHMPGFSAFLKAVFAMRRKTVYNNLKAYAGAEAAGVSLEMCGIQASARAETLSPEKLFGLCAEVMKKRYVD